MSPVAMRIVNDASCATGINHESHTWQAQNLVMLECHFSWQAQYLVKFGKIAGARNVVIGGKSKLGERAGSVLQFHARIMFGSCSDHSRIVRRCK